MRFIKTKTQKILVGVCLFLLIPSVAFGLLLFRGYTSLRLINGVATFTIGKNNIARGALSLLGGPTGSNGGALSLYNAADYDTDIDFYKIHSTEGNLYVSGVTPVHVQNDMLRFGGTSPYYIETIVCTVYTPSSDQTYANDATITIDNTLVRIAGSGGAVTLDTAPIIEDGVSDGQIVILQGTSDTNTVTITDSCSAIAPINCNIELAGSVSFTFGKGDTMKLVWDAGDSTWYEVSRSDN